MSAHKVLARLEAMGILDPKVIGDLRRYLQDAKQSISAEAIVKLLVDKRQLTPFQANKLLADIAESPPAATASPPKAKPTASPIPKAKQTVEEEELMLVDEPAPPTAAKSFDPDDEIVDLEEALPPATSETPIKATLKQVDTPAPPAGEKKKKRVIMPPAPTSITTDDLMVPSPPSSPKPVEAKKSLSPPSKSATSKAAPISGGFEISLPGLQPLSNLPASPLSEGLKPLPPVGGSNDPLANLSPLVADDALLGGLPNETLEEVKPPEPEKPKLKKKKAGTWDSALLMLGGGGLVVLLLAFVILYYALGSRSSNELLEKAHEAYKSAQYPSAQLLYEKFAKDFPSAPEASVAKVRIGMTQLRQSFDGTKDHTSALRIAKAMLPKIESEKKFDEIARPELQSILPDIADGFATQAKKANDIAFMDKMVKLANEAMELVNNPSYLPTTRRKEVQPRIDGILEKIEIAERAIHQDKALQDALLQIEKKLEERSITGAYAVRDQLLQVYPQLERHVEVQKASSAISAREQEFVSSSSPNQSAVADSRYASQHDSITLAKRKGASLTGAEGSISTILVRGAVYALEVATGKVKWRRYVGMETKLQPQLLANGDFLLADQRTHDLLRVGRETNKIVWRQAINEPFQTPVSIGDQIYVSLLSGKLLQINLSDGTITQALNFPQKLLAEMGVDTQTNSASVKAYQVGERATLFTCSLGKTAGAPMSVTETYYLGHKPGSITVPPVVVLGHVFLFENAGLDYSLVHILSRDDEGKIAPLREPIRLRGRVTVPATSNDNKRLVVVTDLGDALVFKVDLSNAASPVSIAARMTGSHEKPILGYHLLDRNKLFIADTRLSEYDVLSTRETLDRIKAEYDGDTFVAPLQLHGRVLLTLRQRRIAQSITVQAYHLDQKQSWELQLAAPITASFAYPETRKFVAITPEAELFTIGSEQFKERVSDVSAASGVVAANLQDALTLSDGRELFLEGSGKSWVLYDPNHASPLKRIELKGTPPLSTVVVMGEGVLGASNTGSIWLLSPTTGQTLQHTTPFQPPLGTDTKITWLPPVAIDETQFAAINAPLKTLYLVRREKQPQSFLTETQKIELGAEPLAMAKLGQTLLVVVRGESADEARIYGVPTLDLKNKLSLEGHLNTRGCDLFPKGIGLETIEKNYLRLGEDGNVLWQSAIANAPLAGAPAIAGNDLLCVGYNGDAILLNDATGEAKPGVRLGEPVLGTPRVLGKRALLNGIDGTLHVVPYALENNSIERGAVQP